jgi:hypothetical protein
MQSATAKRDSHRPAALELIPFVCADVLASILQGELV